MVSKMSETNGSTEQKCLQCGANILVVVGRGRWRKYCNILCSSRYRAKKSKLNLPKCSVPDCISYARSRHYAYCERHYGRLRRTGTLDTKVDVSKHEKCLYCGQPNSNSSNKFCSSRCASRNRRGSVLKANCRVCKKEYIAHQKNVCCSDECNAELHRLYSRNHYAKCINNDDYKNRIRNAEYKRKALKQNAYVEDVEFNAIFDRDGGICWLCREAVNPQLKWPDIGYATLDHVIPLSKGGKHSYDNIKLAHMSCNCKKGAKVVA